MPIGRKAPEPRVRVLFGSISKYDYTSIMALHNVCESAAPLGSMMITSPAVQ